MSEEHLERGEKLLWEGKPRGFPQSLEILVGLTALFGPLAFIAARSWLELSPLTQRVGLPSQVIAPFSVVLLFGGVAAGLTALFRCQRYLITDRRVLRIDGWGRVAGVIALDRDVDAYMGGRDLIVRKSAGFPVTILDLSGPGWLRLESVDTPREAIAALVLGLPADTRLA